MYSYELMQMQVAERRAQFEQEAARIRLSKRSRKSSRTWFRRSATATTTAVAPAPIGEPVVFSGAIPPVGTAEFNEWAAALGRQLAQHGMPSVDAQLRALARRARELHVGGVLSGVLVDRREPEVVRLRAFSRVVTELGALTPARQAELAATA